MVTWGQGSKSCHFCGDVLFERPLKKDRYFRKTTIFVIFKILCATFFNVSQRNSAGKFYSYCSVLGQRLSLLYHFIQNSLNSDSVYFQILFRACKMFAMMRHSENTYEYFLGWLNSQFFKKLASFVLFFLFLEGIKLFQLTSIEASNYVFNMDNHVFLARLKSLINNSQNTIPVDNFYYGKQTFIFPVIAIEPFITIEHCENCS